MRRVFGHVVQQRSGDRARVEAQVGQDAGDRLGMDDVRLARLAPLAGVRLIRKLVRPANQRLVLRRITLRQMIA